MAMPSYLASPLSLGNMQGADYLSTIPGMDLHDQHSNFDSETFVRCVFPVWKYPLPQSPPPHLSCTVINMCFHAFQRR